MREKMNWSKCSLVKMATTDIHRVKKEEEKNDENYKYSSKVQKVKDCVIEPEYNLNRKIFYLMAQQNKIFK